MMISQLPKNLWDMVVTSPPYYGLRDYQLQKTSWPAFDLSILPGFSPVHIPEETCCLGLEKNILAYVAHIVIVFEEVKRILKPHGTLWLNIGDSYAGNGAAYGDDNSTLIGRKHNKLMGAATRFEKKPTGIKSKDMIGVPWLLAFALRGAGWYLRSDIIWEKPNTMPESVNDRPTKAHEYIFLLSKKKKYYYDADAIREPHKTTSIERQMRAVGNNHKHLQGAPGQPPHTIKRERPNVNGKRTPMEAMDLGHGLHVAGSNKRTVWTVNTVPYKGKHYAAFPPRLILPCILAGTSEHGNCAKCGKPYKRITERKLVPLPDAAKIFVVTERDLDADENDQGSNRALDGHKSGYITSHITKGWKKECRCKTDQISRPIVADIFMGTGRTAIVAKKHNRDIFGVELSDQFIKEQLQNYKDLQLFNNIEIIKSLENVCSNTERKR